MENKYVFDKRKRGKKNDAIKSVVERIRKIKRLDVILGVGIVAIVLFFATVSFSPSDTSPVVNSGSEYLQIEERLSEVLSEIDGAGRVSVMINYAGTSELITATTSNTSEDKTVDTDTSGDRRTESKTESVSPVIIQKNGEDTPLIVKEVLPDIVGVIVVAQGADDMSVRIDLMQAVQTLLSVSADKVEIFTMK
ncbi:MAG: hypothetical protein IJF76_01335 [Clostridia bacterium]|nr:hypothetical protein [Clostridia bacterium]